MENPIYIHIITYIYYTYPEYIITYLVYGCVYSLPPMKRFLPSSDADAHETIDQSDEVENHSHLGKMGQMRYSGHGNIETIY